jgi:bifunctional DNase/RNase
VLLEVRVQSLGLERNTNTPVVILQEREGDRVLPIWIGPSEARAIAMQLADWSFSRPLTHDLLVSVIGGLGGVLDRVLISREEEATYFAELIIRRGDETFSVDARPSDSIAVALRMKARIFVDESLFKNVSAEIVEGESVSLELESEETFTTKKQAESLKDYLRKLNPEDFGRFAP